MKNLFLVLFLFGYIPFAFAQQGKPYSNITQAQNGYIGINTPNPDAMLTVKGSIHTQEVVIDLEGAVAPDYVFERYFEGISALNPEYEFLSLSEIEAFIKQYHHLPKMPSAIEFDKNGISLKQMNLLLLEKIEELTLHTIAQQKLIDSLTERIENLERE